MDEQMRADVDTWADEYRLRNQLPPDAPVTVTLGGDGQTAFVYREDSWVFMDGGTLDMGAFRHGPRRWGYLVRRAWGWLRYGGWRWWD